MPVAAGGGSAGSSAGGKGKKDDKKPGQGGGAIPTAPSGPKGNGGGPKPPAPGPRGNGGKTPPKPGPSSGGKGGKGNGGGKGKPGGKGNGGKGKPGGPQSISNQYEQQALNLQGQANALIHALKNDLREGLKSQLGDIDQLMRQQDNMLMQGYRERYGMLKGAAEDNDKSQAAASGANTLNRMRERNNAVAEAMNAGAGESDLLNTQMMSLRNWSANQGEVQRSYFDTLRSVNSSLTDLNVDTKTARINNEVQANADKEQLWTNYFNQESEMYTQLGNTYGQQADHLASAQAYGKGKDAGVLQNGNGGGKGKPGQGKPGGKGNGGGNGGGKGKPGGNGNGGGGGKGKPNNRAALQPMGRIAAAKPGGNGGKIKGGFGGPKDGRPNVAAGPRNGGGKGNGVGPGQGLPAGPGFSDLKPDTIKEARNNAAAAFMNAAEVLGKDWDNPGISEDLRKWRGKDDFQGQNNNFSRLDSAQTVSLSKRPEGATLRRW